MKHLKQVRIFNLSNGLTENDCSFLCLDLTLN